MASKVVPVRIPDAMLAAIDRKVAEDQGTRTDVIIDAVQAYLLDFKREPAPATAAPKAERAKAALASAEARQGVSKARLDTSSVPVFGGGKRPAYQRGQAGQGKAGKGRGR